MREINKKKKRRRKRARSGQGRQEEMENHLKDELVKLLQVQTNSAQELFNTKISNTTAATTNKELVIK